MDDRRTTAPASRRRLAVLAGAAALAGLAGFLAVYVTLAPEGNRALEPPPPAPRAGAPSSPATTDAGPLAGLNRGAMTAFVPRGEPGPVAEAAFLAGEGRERALSDWRGKVVLFNLWATWCAPCREEMPALDRLQGALGGDDFEVVAVSIDLGSADKPRAFLEEIGIEHLALYHDPKARVGSRLRVVGMPTTLLIDREGRELGRLAGPAQWDSPDAQALVRAAIAAGG